MDDEGGTIVEIEGCAFLQGEGGCGGYHEAVEDDDGEAYACEGGVGGECVGCLHFAVLS